MKCFPGHRSRRAYLYRRHTEPWMYTFSMQKMHNFQPANSVVEAEPRLVISPSLPKAMTQRGHAQTTLMSGNGFRDDPRPAAIWGAASPLNKALVAMHLQLTTLPAVNCDRVDLKKRVVCRQTGEARLSLPSLNNEVMEWKLRPIRGGGATCRAKCKTDGSGETADWGHESRC